MFYLMARKFFQLRKVFSRFFLLRVPFFAHPLYSQSVLTEIIQDLFIVKVGSGYF